MRIEYTEKWRGDDAETKAIDYSELSAQARSELDQLLIRHPRGYTQPPERGAAYQESPELIPERAITYEAENELRVSGVPYPFSFFGFDRTLTFNYVHPPHELEALLTELDEKESK